MDFQQLGPEDHAFSIEDESALLANTPFNKAKTFSVSEFSEKILQVVQRSTQATQTNVTQWTEEGFQGRVLKVGAPGWVSGKIRVRLVFEFCPDPPEDIENVGNATY